MRNQHVFVTPNYRPHKFLSHWSLVIGHYLLSAFLRVPLPLYGCILALHTALATTNDLATALQKGLFEEEANHNFPAAIEAYQSVINHFDEDRKLAATAIFRVGEIYRKQGKTNEANAQYERVVREFSDQSQLATLSQSYLAAATASPINASANNPNSESAPTSDEAEEVRKMRAMIRDSPDLINATDDNGNTRLHDAASAGQVVVARFLIENGANVNAQNRFGTTPLYHAAMSGHKALVELLLDHGANVQFTDSYGNTPLHTAAKRGFRSIIEVLLAHGADVNATNRYGSTPLHLAVANGFKSVAELLLSQRADVSPVTSDARDEQNHIFNGTPLHIAVTRDDQPIAELLLANKANPNTTNSTGDTALHIAASHGNQKLIELLLANKAKVDAIDKQGETPLDFAAKSGHANATEMLVGHGADANARNPVEGAYKDWTPLLYAAVNRHDDTVVLLLKRGADPNASIAAAGSGWNRGTTALLMASRTGDAGIFEALLDCKANPNTRDATGLSPMKAVMGIQEAEKRKQMLSTLLEHGGDVEAPDERGETPLILACLIRDKVSVDLLLSYKANVNAKDPRGWTALLLAVTSLFDGATPDVSQQIIEALLAAGANVNLQNNDGRTALSYLLKPDRPVPFNGGPIRSKVEQLLREHGAVTDLPRADVIELRRPDANFAKVIFTKGTNGWDQFTLFDLIGVHYHLLSASPGGDKRSENVLSPKFVSAGGLAFPDFAHIRIRHPKPEVPKGWDERTIDISEALSSGHCSADVPLELGDQVEIPEADHVLNARWDGLSTNILETFKRCLTRNISVFVKGQSNSISLGPEIKFAGSPVPNSPTAKYAGTGVFEFAPIMIKPALEESQLLLASSDLSRIKLKRTDPATGQKRELIVDCSGGKPAPSVWLRDGDIIEVPDKP